MRNLHGGQSSAAAAIQRRRSSVITGGDLHHAGKGSSGGGGASGASGSSSSAAAMVASCWAFLVYSISINRGGSASDSNAAAQQRKVGSRVEMVAGGVGGSQPRSPNDHGAGENDGEDEDERSIASRASSIGTRSTAPSVTSQVNLILFAVLRFIAMLSISSM